MDIFWVRATSNLSNTILTLFAGIVVVIQVSLLNILLDIFTIKTVIILAAFPSRNEKRVATVITLFEHELVLEFFICCFFLYLSHGYIDIPNMSSGPSHFHAAFSVVLIWFPITAK